MLHVEEVLVLSKFIAYKRFDDGSIKYLTLEVQLIHPIKRWVWGSNLELAFKFKTRRQAHARLGYIGETKMCTFTIFDD